MKSLKSLLDCNEFACVDTTKLQGKLDELEEILSNEIAPFKINNKNLVMDSYNTERIIEVK
jgi:hypothetical protein